MDTTPPWQKVKLLGTGGQSGSGGGLAIDASQATGGSQDSGAGGALDVGGGGAGGAAGGIDGPLAGAGGGADAGLGGAGGLGGGPGIDAPLLGTGGVSAIPDAEPDVRLPGSGGAGGTSRTGGAIGTGGTTGTGGAIGAGGATAFDAGPDLAPDLTADLAPDLASDSAPDVTPDTSTLGLGLVAYYRFEGASGTTLSDSSGNGYNGTLGIGAPPDGGAAPSGTGYSFAAGKVGNALVLTRAGYGYVSLPTAVFANITDFTVAVWVNVKTMQNWQRIFDVGVNANIFIAPPTGAKYMNLTPRNDKNPAVLRFSITSNGISGEESLNTTPLPTDAWKHVAIVLSGGIGWLYIDGAQVYTDPTVLTPAGLGAIDYAYLGKSQFGSDPYFDGMLDEFRVYNRALSAAEIQALFQLTGP